MEKKFHPNNKHNKPYDFKTLIFFNKNLENFLKTINGTFTIDFSDPLAVKELNRALLMSYYGITYWEFPDNNLCPPVPGRVDYLHYLSDLVEKDIPVKVLDIGTGASCIYPLLGVSLFNWEFTATDIDFNSLKSAQEIITKNNLSDRIELRTQDDYNHILDGIIRTDDNFTFTMCNPPFYKDLVEANSVNGKKNKNLGIQNRRNFSGNVNELCYKGGEKAFLHTYLYESSKFPNASNWFTSLVSKKENIKSLQDSSKKLGASEFKEIQMHQGNKITRIACWKF